jgi:hypothetical protein
VHPSRTSRSPFPAAPRQPDPLITAAPAADALPTIEAPVTDWCAHVSKICERLRQASSADDIAFWDTAMRRAAQGYLHRAFQPVRCKEDLLTHGHLAMCFAWHGCTNAVSRLAQEFASLDVRLAEFDVVNADLLCDLACAYAQGGASNQHVTRAMRELADEVHHRLKGDQHYFCLSNVDRLLAAFDPRSSSGQSNSSAGTIAAAGAATAARTTGKAGKSGMPGAAGNGCRQRQPTRQQQKPVDNER